MAVTAVDICNRALQKLGAASITSLTDGSRNADSCNTAYEPVRDALLQSHPWNFAIKRAILTAAATASSGTDWEAVTLADQSWTGVAYGGGVFVAVSAEGNAAYSTDYGTTWTIVAVAGAPNLQEVAYGEGVFVTVGAAGAAFYSLNGGVSWTAGTAMPNRTWNSVTYGNGTFVAVGSSGTGDRAAYSSDGITWIAGTSAADNSWISVTYGASLFVAVAFTGTGNRVMTSPDGNVWTIRTSARDLTWLEVRYGGGVFVAVASSGAGERVMTSTNGIAWTIREAASAANWRGLEYGNGVFTAVGTVGSAATGSDRIMSSTDGIVWTLVDDPYTAVWNGVAYGAGYFVAVGQQGTAVQSAMVAPVVSAPAFGEDYHYSLPDDYLRFISPAMDSLSTSYDWLFENNLLLTDDSEAPEIRYVAKITDPDEMSPLFREALAAELAFEMCEEITQSNQKWQLLQDQAKKALNRAKRFDAQEQPSEYAPDASWVTVRGSGSPNTVSRW